jgi:hypothetical protein
VAHERSEADSSASAERDSLLIGKDAYALCHRHVGVSLENSLFSSLRERLNLSSLLLVHLVASVGGKRGGM